MEKSNHRRRSTFLRFHAYMKSKLSKVDDIDVREKALLYFPTISDDLQSLVHDPS